MKFNLMICPKCVSTVDDDYEYGCSCEECGYAGDHFVELEYELGRDVVSLYAKIESLVDLERFKLAQIEREDAFAQAERDWYANLSVADKFWEDSRRKRRKRERREEAAKEGGLALTMHDLIVDSWSDSLTNLTRQLYSDSPLLTILNGRRIKPDALDVWLSEGKPVDEVLVALELKDPPLEVPADQMKIAVHGGFTAVQ